MPAETAPTLTYRSTALRPRSAAASIRELFRHCTLSVDLYARAATSRRLRIRETLYVIARDTHVLRREVRAFSPGRLFGGRVRTPLRDFSAIAAWVLLRPDGGETV